MAEYYQWHNSSRTRWVNTVPLPAGQRNAESINWVTKGAVTTPTSQGRCATCQAFSCIADVEGAWFTGGHPLTKLSEQEMIDCGSGDQYGMRWIEANGGVASIVDAPLANHSDPNITGCRGITNCATVERKSSAYLNGSTCLTNHVESNILALLQHGPMSVSINAGPLNGYHGGVINCSGDGIDHAVTLVAHGTDGDTGEGRRRPLTHPRTLTLHWPLPTHHRPPLAQSTGRSRTPGGPTSASRRRPGARARGSAATPA